jgi:predicted DsbA family dithiol-disulfide isomerase
MAATPLKIDFVSDVSCPWCAVGLNALEQALQRLDGEVQAELHFQPFELNPQMAPEGEDIVEHITAKYGTTPAQVAQNQESIRLRGEAVGFVFDMSKRQRIHNTFDAHRLLHWAALEGRQRALKHALFAAYFTDGEDVSLHEVLVRAAERVGLDGARARAVLASEAYAAEVRAQQRFYAGHGIHSVPAVIINDRHLISGGQPPEVFEQALRQIAAESRRAD